jgi:hypothetical protein
MAKVNVAAAGRERPGGAPGGHGQVEIDIPVRTTAAGQEQIHAGRGRARRERGDPYAGIVGLRHTHAEHGNGIRCKRAADHPARLQAGHRLRASRGTDRVRMVVALDADRPRPVNVAVVVPVHAERAPGRKRRCRTHTARPDQDQDQRKKQG